MLKVKIGEKEFEYLTSLLSIGWLKPPYAHGQLSE